MATWSKDASFVGSGLRHFHRLGLADDREPEGQKREEALKLLERSTTC
jgi:hypothetical protein